MSSRMFDVTGFFDQEAFSDIVVKFGARERKCHKMILCSKSKYFDDLCGPGKSSSESQQPFVELKDDDEEAVEAMLRWLYTFDYEQRTVAKEEDGSEPYAFAQQEERATLDKPDNTLDFHLNVCMVADKYSLAALEKEAISRLQAGLMSAAEDPFVDFFNKAWYLSVQYSQAVLETVDACRDQRLESLLQHSKFRILVAADTELCMEIIDKLRAGNAAPKLGTGLVEKRYIRCHCGREDLRDGPAAAFTCTGFRYKYVHQASSWKQCWMKPEDL